MSTGTCMPTTSTVVDRLAPHPQRLIHHPAQPTIPFDAFGEFSAQANDSQTFIFVLYWMRKATSSFSFICYLLDNRLSTG